LMVKGNREVLQGPCISIVGARKATQNGKDVAFEIGRDLAREGITVVSGMAYGIDAAAHHGALEEGRTVAVWGSGIDRCYPAVFRDLSQKIERNGCLVSEFPLGTPPDHWNFPQRNRIISGLSLGVVIVEAASQSGSLITARFALEQGREVFAVPGPAGGTMSQGTHMLLRSGATFVERAEDVIIAITPQLPPTSKNSRHFGSDDINDRPLLKFIPFDGVRSLDEIIRESEMSSAEVMKELTVLMLEGVIEELPGKQYRRKNDK
jgi:DNA processing protein